MPEEKETISKGLESPYVRWRDGEITRTLTGANPVVFRARPGRRARIALLGFRRAARSFRRSGDIPAPQGDLAAVKFG